MRGEHCLKVWTKKQQVVSLSTATPQSKPRQKSENSQCDEGPGHRMWVAPTSGCHSDDVL